MKQEPNSISFAAVKTLATLVTLIASATFMAGLAGGQPNMLPQFEVSSVKLRPLSNGPGAGFGLSPQRTGGTIRWHAPLRLILCYAYQLPGWQVSLKGEMPFYEIAAKTDPLATEDDVRLMFQALLSDRLKIVFHRVTKETTGYALVVAKEGPKLKTANSRGAAPPMPEFLQRPPEAFENRIFTSVPHGKNVSAIVGRGVSIAQLAAELSEDLGTFVVDRTGLAGKYYFGFIFASDSGSDEVSDAASVFSVLPSELGLRLEKEKGRVELLVVDQFENPTGN